MAACCVQSQGWRPQRGGKELGQKEKGKARPLGVCAPGKDGRGDSNCAVREPFRNQQACQAPGWWPCLNPQAHLGRSACTFMLFQCSILWRGARGRSGERTGHERSHRVPQGEFAQQPGFWNRHSLLFGSGTGFLFSLSPLLTSVLVASLRIPLLQFPPPSQKAGVCTQLQATEKWVKGPSPCHGVSPPPSSFQHTPLRPSPGWGLLKATQLEAP